LEAIVAEHKVKAIVLDSATALFSPRPSQDQLSNHFFQLVHSLGRMGLTSIILAESPQDMSQLTTLGVDDYVCDLVVILRNAIEGDRRRRSIEVNKYRRSAHFKGEYPCTITTRGLMIFPQNPREHPTWSRLNGFRAAYAASTRPVDAHSTSWPPLSSAASMKMPKARSSSTSTITRS